MYSRQVSNPGQLLDLRFVSDLHLSADGAALYYLQSRIEAAKPTRYLSQIHVWDGSDRTLTQGEQDSCPAPSPDGRLLAFLRKRSPEERPQAYVLPLGGGEATSLPGLKTGASDLAFSPDGRFLAMLSQGDDDLADEGPAEVRVVTRLRYRFNGRGMLSARPKRLFLYRLEDGSLRPLGSPTCDISEYVWAPDGQSLLYIAAPSQEAEDAWQQEVFRQHLDGRCEQLTRWGGTLAGLAPHPDGQRFAAAGRPEGVRNDQDNHLYCFEGDSWRRIDPEIDFPVGNLVGGDQHFGRLPTHPVWEDEEHVVALYTVGGSTALYRIGLGGDSQVLLHHPQRVISAFDLSGGALALVDESPTELPAAYFRASGHSEITPVTGQAYPGELPPLFPEVLEVGGVEGWVLRQPVSGGKMPVVLAIHGGPHTAYGYTFMHEFQLLAQRGYAVLYCNPRGSVGYGQAFADAIYGRWGTVDFQDILGFLDGALQRYPELDRDRCAVMGGSYGGYMTNWVVGHTDRFKAAITDRSICNLLSFNGTSDIGAMFWPEELGLSFQNAADIQRLWEMSPLSCAERVRTPTLLIHSEADYRCPIEQAEQWYLALRLQGVPARLVRFPEETHELSRSGRPDRRVRRLEEMLQWLDRYLATP
jgi:dipeptidyl aminopeptidase/acylaminoacyl peptidase